MRALQEEVEARLQLALMMAPPARFSQNEGRSSRANSPSRDTSTSMCSAPPCQDSVVTQQGVPSLSHTTQDCAGRKAANSTPHELQAAVIAMQNLWALSCQLSEVTVAREKVIESQPSIDVAVRLLHLLCIPPFCASLLGFVFYAPRAGAVRHTARTGAWLFWAVRRSSEFRELGYL